MKMRNILENKFWWAARSFAAVVLFSVSTLSANVFISEIGDPNNSSNGRFVEIYNSGSADIDLSAEVDTSYKDGQMGMLIQLLVRQRFSGW